MISIKKARNAANAICNEYSKSNPSQARINILKQVVARKGWNVNELIYIIETQGIKKGKEWVNVKTIQSTKTTSWIA